MFSSVENGALFEFNEIASGQSRLSLRAFSENPAAFRAEISFLTAMGTELESQILDLEFNPDVLTPLEPEQRIGRYQPGEVYQFSADFRVPDQASRALLRMPHLDRDKIVLVVQATKIETLEQPAVDSFASHAFVYVDSSAPSVRVMFSPRAEPSDQVTFISLTMSDLIGDGPGLLQLRRFTKAGEEIPPSSFEARDREQRVMRAVPRVRVLERPTRTLHTFPTKPMAPHVFDGELSMIQESTHGYFNLLATQVVRNKEIGIPQSPKAILRLSSEIYEGALESSKDELVKLLY